MSEASRVEHSTDTEDCTELDRRERKREIGAGQSITSLLYCRPDSSSPHSSLTGLIAMVAVLARSLTPEPVTMGGMSAHRAHYTDLSPPSKQTTKSWKRGQGRDERRERYYKERKEKERKRGREKQRYFLLYPRPVSLFLGEKKTGVYIYQARSGWWPGLKIRVASEHITVNYTLYSRRPRNETKNTKP